MIRWAAGTPRTARFVPGQSTYMAAPLYGLRRLAHWLVRLTVLAVLAGVVLLGAGFLMFVNAIQRSESPPAQEADGIVVLTGGAQRIGDAVDLLMQGKARRLLISGVNEKTSRSQIARLNPDAQRLFNCCVDLDYRARNTIGNAIETRRWAREHDFRSLIIVTSNYHMPRTLVELSSILHEQDLRPHVVVSDQGQPDRWWYDAGTARLLLSEYAKFLVAFIRTRFEQDPEHSRAAIVTGGRKPSAITPEALAHGRS